MRRSWREAARDRRTRARRGPDSHPSTIHQDRYSTGIVLANEHLSLSKAVRGRQGSGFREKVLGIRIGTCAPVELCAECGSKLATCEGESRFLISDFIREKSPFCQTRSIARTKNRRELVQSQQSVILASCMTTAQISNVVRQFTDSGFGKPDGPTSYTLHKP